jgi:hypothetical protein
LIHPLWLPKAPIKHYYENGILKYGEPWTGDIWKVVHYIFKNFSDKITFNYWNHPYYRGVGKIIILEEFQIPEDAIDEINNYTYEDDFPEYLDVILSLSK